jgi:DDB1- and CUL4-associated factor 7
MILRCRCCSHAHAQISKRVQEPILAYCAEGEVNSLQWSTKHPEWIAIAFDRKMQILHI